MTRLLLVAGLLVVVACAPGTQRARGVVTAVDGDLSSIRSFTLETDDGPLTFEPAEGFTFDGGPGSHLFDHLRSSEPVEVRFRDEANRLIAVDAGDA